MTLTAFLAAGEGAWNLCRAANDQYPKGLI
jgi:hypothetical protein